MIMMGRQSGLGKGLGAIIPQKPSPSQTPTASSWVEEPDAIPFAPEEAAPEVSPTVMGMRIEEVRVSDVDPNPHQPREHFDHQALDDLVTSIKEHGVMQPIVVTKNANGRFELIAGERRLRASKIAGRETIPAIIRSATEQDKFELAIIENIQRQDLNPIEEAKAYLRLQSEFNLTQDEIGIRVGKSRPQVGNIIRLLQLPAEIQDALQLGKITMSNARTLLSLPSDSERLQLFHDMLAGQFTVRQTEARIPRSGGGRRPSAPQDPNLAALEMKMRDALGTKVTIKQDPKGEGEIKIVFLNEEDLRSIVDKLGGE